VQDGKGPIRKRDQSGREAARNICLLKVIAAGAFESREAKQKGDGNPGAVQSALPSFVQMATIDQSSQNGVVTLISFPTTVVAGDTASPFLASQHNKF